MWLVDAAKIPKSLCVDCAIRMGKSYGILSKHVGAGAAKVGVVNQI